MLALLEKPQQMLPQHVPAQQPELEPPPPQQTLPLAQQLPLQQEPPLHDVPLGCSGVVQLPEEGSQTPAVWHWSTAVQITVAPGTQTPL